ncbi:hypothetical protein HaLaN_19502 [Haematococcus lacustris]|uniref:Uncharacterized protein n=1 Tax=Haematococcus lacustris TaxID=44745 RepID=A0A699ZIJ2_HAELA|nr:hypothetical protein HaLaN_19502 [Haematococcus lacustris]
MDGAAGGRVGKVGVDKEVQTGTELLEGVVGGREGSSLVMGSGHFAEGGVPSSIGVQPWRAGV